MPRSILPFVLLLSRLTAFATPPQLALNISSYLHPNCFESNGEVHVYAVNGTEPYTYTWDDGPVGQDRTGLPGGTYTATVTDGLGATATRSITLVSGYMTHPGVTYAGLFACPGQANGTFALVNSEATGTPPYTTQVTVNGNPWSQSGVNVQDDPLFTGIATGAQVDYTVTDVNGCIGQGSFLMYGPLGVPVVISNNLGACGPVGGSIHIDPSSSDWPVDLQVIRNADAHTVSNVLGTTFPLDLTDLQPGDYTILQSWTWSMLNTCDPMIQMFTIADMGPDCGTVSGASWYDLDADCTHDANEVAIPYSTLLVQPGDQYALTNGDGRYSYRLMNGAYTLAQTDPTLAPICPATQPVPFTVASNAQVVDLANGSTEPLDLALYVTQGAARPGMQQAQWATVRNLSPQASGPVTVTCTFDAQLVYTSASPAPSSVVGNVITWEFPAFGTFHWEHLYAFFQVPASTPLGAPLMSVWAMSNTLPDADASNDGAVLSTTVVGSFDPNDKTVRTSTAQADGVYLIGEDSYLDYTIRFQNTGTDTAFIVVVTDTLDAALDMASFEQGTASHAFDVAFKPGRVVEWRFANILLPDSNTNEGASHGLVQFRIKPKAPLTAGTEIRNNADIFFDLNAPVRTNDAVVVLETSTQVQLVGAGVGPQGQVAVFPNPANELLNVSLPATVRGACAAELIAMDGRVVRSAQVLFNEGKGVLPVTGTAPGVYILRLHGQGDLTWTTRFVMR